MKMALAIFAAAVLFGVGNATAEVASPAPRSDSRPTAVVLQETGKALTVETLKSIKGRGALRCNEGCNAADSVCMPSVYGCQSGQKWYPQMECDYHVFACGDDCAKGAEKVCADNEICVWSGFWNCVHSSWSPGRKTNQCS